MTVVTTRIPAVVTITPPPTRTTMVVARTVMAIIDRNKHKTTIIANNGAGGMTSIQCITEVAVEATEIILPTTTILHMIIATDLPHHNITAMIHTAIIII
jgi:hypothetical protein